MSSSLRQLCQTALERSRSQVDLDAFVEYVRDYYASAEPLGRGEEEAVKFLRDPCLTWFHKREAAMARAASAVSPVSTPSGRGGRSPHSSSPSSYVTESTDKDEIRTCVLDIVRNHPLQLIETQVFELLRGRPYQKDRSTYQDRQDLRTIGDMIKSGEIIKVTVEGYSKLQLPPEPEPNGFELNGRRYTIGELERHEINRTWYRLGKPTISRRLKAGMSAYEALTTPRGNRNGLVRGERFDRKS